MRLSVIVPAYNESKRIAALLEAIDHDLAEMRGDYEVVVVDDGSTDGTSELVGGGEVRLIIHKKNQGKAAAVQTGLASSRGHFVAVLDADMEYMPADLISLLNATDGTSEEIAVYGSRYLAKLNFRPGAAGAVRLLRGQEVTSWIANWVLTTLVLLLYGKLLTDTLTGLKLYPGRFLRSQELKSTGFEGDHEITARLIRAKIPIDEVPIRYRPRSRLEGKKIGPVDGFVAVWTFIRYRLV